MLVRHGEGADPAAVVFDSIKAGVARNVDVIICDTAGRLHNKANLMNELSKINRIIDRQLPGCAKEVLLVIDATTGQNALVQAAEFKQAAGVTGIVLTKLDGTAKGGIAIAICDSEKLPVRFVGVGEQVDDLMPFDADSFVDAMFD
jgi:fused signal recognition particle receptor